MVSEWLPTVPGSIKRYEVNKDSQKCWSIAPFWIWGIQNARKKNSKKGHLKKQKAGCKSSGESNPQNRIGQQGIVSVSSPKMAQQIATEVGKWPNKSGLFYYYLCADNVAETQDHDFRYCFFLCVFVRVEFHEFSWISDKYNIHSRGPSKLNIRAAFNWGYTLLSTDVGRDSIFFLHRHHPNPTNKKSNSGLEGHK